jgi:hypothetical protein
LDFSIALATRLIDLCMSGESVSRQGDELLVAFHSKADPAEILNVRSSTPITGNGHVYGPLLDSYRQEVKPPSLSNANQIWLTGHGIGAAYAILAATELQNITGVYTFGAPRVGDREFVNNFPCPVFRVVNDLDVMVTMPPPWHWRHLGIQKLINSDGSLNPHPHAWNRLPSLTRQTVWLGEMLMQGLATGYPRSLHTLLTKVLNDHAPESYQTRLHALEDRSR